MAWREGWEGRCLERIPADEEATEGQFEVEEEVLEVVVTLGAGEVIVEFGVVQARWEYDRGDGGNGCAAEGALGFAHPGAKNEAVAGFGGAPGVWADGLEFGAGSDEFCEGWSETADEGDDAGWVSVLGDA